MLVVKDPVYSEYKITNPIISELIHTSVFQRLKDITQSGMPNGLNKYDSFSRYEHSIGVYLLLEKYGATLHEQIAGLLHDIAHRAFSHIYEWILDENQSSIEGSSESDTDNFLRDKEILAILKKYSIQPISHSDYENFRLLDSPIPDLCADRLDYSFREYLKYKGDNSLYEKVADKILFSNEVNSFYFDDVQSAELYGYEFLELQENVWGSWDSVFRYQSIREIAIQLIDGGEITIEDFDHGESKILDKFYSSKKVEVQKFVEILKQRDINSKPIFQKNIVKKFRFVDPYTISHGKLVRLSSVSNSFSKAIEQARERNKLGQLV
jgi:uncharacterized protein